MPKKTSLDMESTLAELSKTIHVLESENTSLQDSLSAFEQGVSLIKQAQQALDDASQRVNQLLESSDEEDAPPVDETPE